MRTAASTSEIGAPKTPPRPMTRPGRASPGPDAPSPAGPVRHSRTHFGTVRVNPILVRQVRLLHFRPTGRTTERVCWAVGRDGRCFLARRSRPMYCIASHALRHLLSTPPLLCLGSLMGNPPPRWGPAPPVTLSRNPHGLCFWSGFRRDK